MVGLFLTVAEFANLIEKSKPTALARIRKYGGKTRVGNCRGGKRIEVDLTSLPQEYHLLYNRYKLEQQLPAFPDPEIEKYLPAKPEPTHALVLKARSGRYIPSEELTRKASAKAETVRVYLQYIGNLPHGKKAAGRKAFQRNFKQTYPHLYNKVGRVNWKTIEYWKKKLERNDSHPACLIDTRGTHLRGACSLSDEQKEILLNAYLHPNKPKKAEAIRNAREVMEIKGIPRNHSISTCRRFLNEVELTRYHITTYTREGESAYENKCAYTLERDYDKIGVGDILVGDGHVLNFEIIDPRTGKPKRMVLTSFMDMKSNYPLGWEISPTETTQSYVTALYRSLLLLGKTCKVLYLDHGRAGKGYRLSGNERKEIEGICQRLAIKKINSLPYHGQSKTIERQYGTLAEFERGAVSHVGSSVTNKPPRMNMGERWHRRLYEKTVEAAGMPTVESTHQALSHWLFEKYAKRPQQGHLNGRTPEAVFLEGKGPGVDPLELTVLMMEQKHRTVNKIGISVKGINYYHPSLMGYRKKVNVRYDTMDPTAIYVFDLSGEFLCRARMKEKVHPAANITGNQEDQRRLEDHLRLKNRTKREASGLVRDLVDNHVMPQYRLQLELNRHTNTGPKDDPETVEMIKASQEDMSPEALARRDAEQQEFNRRNRIREHFRNWDNERQDGKYDLCIEAVFKKVPLEKEHIEVLRNFRVSPHYKRFSGYFNDVRKRYYEAYWERRPKSTGNVADIRRQREKEPTATKERRKAV